MRPSDTEGGANTSGPADLAMTSSESLIGNEDMSAAGVRGEASGDVEVPLE